MGHITGFVARSSERCVDPGKVGSNAAGSGAFLHAFMPSPTLAPMPHFRRSVLGSALLGLALLAGCKTIQQPPQVQTAGMRVDVLKVSSTQRKQIVEVKLKIWNDHEQRVSFNMGNVRILWNGREVSAKPYRERDGATDIQAKSNREFHWLFEIGDVITEGTYPVEIRDLKLADVPLGDTAAFKINVGA